MLASGSGAFAISCAYFEGGGVERDMKMAKHYWELAAIGGHAMASTILA